MSLKPHIDENGACHCGAVTFSAIGSVQRVEHCHCTDCRNISGAAFLTWVDMARADVTWGGSDLKYYASNNGIKRGFCGHCGSTLTFEGGNGDVICIALGAFDNPDIFQPESHLHTQSRLHWAHLQGDPPNMSS